MVEFLRPLLALSRALSEVETSEELFEVALDTLAQAVGVRRSAILTFDAAGVMRFRAWRGLSDEYRAAVDGHSPWRADGPEPDVWPVADVLQTPALAAFAPMILAEGIRALMFVPVIYRGRLLGKFMLYGGQPRLWTPTEIDLASTIAFHVGFVLERQRLAEEATLRLASETAARREAEEAWAAWHRSERHYRAVGEAIPFGFVLSDPDGRIEYVSPSFLDLLGLTLADVQAGRMAEAMDPDQRRRLVEQWRRCRAELVPFDAEYSVRGADGRTWWILGRSVPVQEEDGRVIGWIGQNLDVTERKNVEEALRQSLREQARELAERDRLKTQFLANVSHEIRTPMNGILGMAGLLQDSPLTDEQSGFVRTIRTCADSLLALLNDILDLSRIEAGKLALETMPFRPSAVVAEAVELLRVLSVQRGVTVRAELAPQAETPRLGDPGRIRQVLVNLLSNALKSSPPGEVVVAVVEELGTLRFEVRDEGLGIPPEQHDRLFQAFSQVEGPQRDRASGAGLGLAISKRLVDLMAGEIGFRSAPGQGSCFWFRVPLPETAEAPAAPAPDLRPDWRPGRPVRILVAEDNPINQRVTLLQLQKLGYLADAVGNGREVLEVLESVPYDLILMDCQMPELDGYEAARRIRQRPNGRGPIIVALTAHAMRGERERCLENGMDDYLTKPVRPEHLAQVLDRWLPEVVPAGA